MARASEKRAKAEAAAKAKRQKLIVAVGGVLLLAILAYEIPHTMKTLNQLNGNSSASSSAATTTTASTTPAPTGTIPPAAGSLTPPTLQGSAAASTPASSSGLVNSDPAPVAQDGQLSSFNRFASKDPFSQQLDVSGSQSSGGSSGSTTTTTTPPDGSGSPVPPGGTTTPTTTQPTPPPANPTIATISVNGVSEDVQIGQTFPASAAQPYFQLVSLAPNQAKIGIAGGSLATGAPTVTLVKGRTLTLQNTADGTKYALQLVATK